MVFIAMWHTFLRSFFLQTLWNFERLQNVGFAFSIEPLLRRLDIPKEVFRKALRRQMVYFNTHPYFATIVMGVVFWKEQSRSEDHEKEDPTISVLKDSMGGAFGALGDHVIWGTWRPFAALLALCLGIMVASPTRAWGACAQWWIVGFLCMFNAPHLWLRWRGLQKAIHDGPGVVRWIESLYLQSWAAQIRRLGLLLLVVLVLAYLGRWSSSNLLIWMVGVLLGTIVFKRWSMSGFAVFYLICAGTLALGFFWDSLT